MVNFEFNVIKTNKTFKFYIKNLIDKFGNNVALTSLISNNILKKFENSLQLYRNETNQKYLTHAYHFKNVLNTQSNYDEESKSLVTLFDLKSSESDIKSDLLVELNSYKLIEGQLALNKNEKLVTEDGSYDVKFNYLFNLFLRAAQKNIIDLNGNYVGDLVNNQVIFFIFN
jgi:hypothetical protein